MPHPNQITACATATRQGIYTPEVHMYAEVAHPKYGLLPVSYFFKGRTRNRNEALATARAFVKLASNMTPSDAREFLTAHSEPRR